MEERRRGYRPRCMSYSMVVTSMEKGASGYVSGGGTVYINIKRNKDVCV
jgi:hypothetical protein